MTLNRLSGRIRQNISSHMTSVLVNLIPIYAVFLPPTKEEVNAFARVCLSVCLLARLLKNASMDLDEMLHIYVDRCRDTEELVNF